LKFVLSVIDGPRLAADNSPVVRQHNKAR
jgi:hypothetical protein